MPYSIGLSTLFFSLQFSLLCHFRTSTVGNQEINIIACLGGQYSIVYPKGMQKNTFII